MIASSLHAHRQQNKQKSWNRKTHINNTSTSTSHFGFTNFCPTITFWLFLFVSQCMFLSRFYFCFPFCCKTCYLSDDLVYYVRNNSFISLHRHLTIIVQRKIKWFYAIINQNITIFWLWHFRLNIFCYFWCRFWHLANAWQTGRQANEMERKKKS